MPVTIERFLDPWEAHVVKARLVAEGIDASVSNDQLATDWPIAFAVGGAALRVPESDAARVQRFGKPRDAERFRPEASTAMTRADVGRRTQERDGGIGSAHAPMVPLQASRMPLSSSGGARSSRSRAKSPRR